MRLSNLLFLILVFVIILIVIGLGGTLIQFLDWPSLLFVLVSPILISLVNFRVGELVSAFRDVFARERKARGVLVFKALASYSLSFGVVGTLIGLVSMLARMEDPAQVGPQIATSLITTLYGLLLGQFLYLPLATHIENESVSQITTM